MSLLPSLSCLRLITCIFSAGVPWRWREDPLRSRTWLVTPSGPELTYPSINISTPSSSCPSCLKCTGKKTNRKKQSGSSRLADPGCLHKVGARWVNEWRYECLVTLTFFWGSPSEPYSCRITFRSLPEPCHQLYCGLDEQGPFLGSPSYQLWAKHHSGTWYLPWGVCTLGGDREELSKHIHTQKYDFT